MNKLAILAVFAVAVLAASVEVNAQSLCFKEGWKIDADSTTYPLYKPHPSFGTWYESVQP